MPRYLGQHFLINKAAVAKIIAALDLQSGDTIIEIGPGEGALTIPLARRCGEINCKIIAIEKDPRLVSSINNKVSGIKIIEGDALKVLPLLHAKYLTPNTEYKVVGNIPYYITGKLLRVLSELENKPKLIVLTIQREVAERLVAEPPGMNLLAAATQIWSKPGIIGYLKPKDFQPAPDVESAMIKLEIELKISEKAALEDYYRLIKIIFKQPRKTLLNNLSTGLNKPKEEVLKTLQNMGLKGGERPQNLNVSAIQKLSQKLFTS